MLMRFVFSNFRQVTARTPIVIVQWPRLLGSISGSPAEFNNICQALMHAGLTPFFIIYLCWNRHRSCNQPIQIFLTYDAMAPISSIIEDFSTMCQ